MKTNQLNIQTKFFLIFGVGIITGAALGIGGFFLFSSFTTKEHEDNEQVLYGWDRNNVIRQTLKPQEVYVDNIESTYTAKKFQNTFNPGDIYKNEYTDYGYDFKYENNTYVQASNLANLLVKINREDHHNHYLAAWDNPSNYNGDGTLAKISDIDRSVDNNSNQTTPTDTAVVWQSGGPVGEVSLDQMAIGARIYQKIGHLYTFAQSQYGFNPRYLLFKKYFGNSERVIRAVNAHNFNYLNTIKNPVDHTFFNGYPDKALILNKIRHLQLSEIEALKFLENTPLNADVNNVLLSASLSFSKLDADVMKSLGDKLKAPTSNTQTSNPPQYKHLFMAGISYGHSAVMNGILYNDDTINEYDGFLASSNSIWSARKGSMRLTGGFLNKEQEQSYKGSGGLLDVSFFFAMQSRKIAFGMQKDLERKITNNNSFKNFIQHKLLLSFNKDDYNIGNIGNDEKNLYTKNNIHFLELDNGNGHNNFPTDDNKYNHALQDQFKIDTWWSK